MTVAELLAASRVAHQEYRRVAGSIDMQGKVAQPFDDAACVAAVTVARDMRLQAHQADPQHTDPAWQSDKADHVPLMRFYQEFLRPQRRIDRQRPPRVARPAPQPPPRVR